MSVLLLFQVLFLFPKWITLTFLFETGMHMLYVVTILPWDPLQRKRFCCLNYYGEKAGSRSWKSAVFSLVSSSFIWLHRWVQLSSSWDSSERCASWGHRALERSPGHAWLRLQATASGFRVQGVAYSGRWSFEPTLTPHWRGLPVSHHEGQMTDCCALPASRGRRLLQDVARLCWAGWSWEVGGCELQAAAVKLVSQGRRQSCNALRNLIGRQSWDHRILPEGWMHSGE